MAADAGPEILGYWVLGLPGSIALVLVTLPVGALLGVYQADVVHFSAFQQLLDQHDGAAGADELPVSTGVFVALQPAVLPLAAVINIVPVLGEELGWRGWLLPRLMPLGALPAILITGVIWGVWHAPLVLLGYNYPDAPGWLGVLAMVVMCTLIGAIFGWLRLRSVSVWPAALAHAALNGAAGTPSVLFAEARAHRHHAGDDPRLERLDRATRARRVPRRHRAVRAGGQVADLRLTTPQPLGA